MSATEPAEALILIEVPSVDMRTTALMEDRVFAGAAPKPLPLTSISPGPLPPINIPTNKMAGPVETPTPSDSGDPTGRAVLFERYSEQIQARIERSWRRPRSPVHDEDRLPGTNIEGRSDGKVPADDSFQCQVQIIQDGDGAIKEVTLLRCNGSIKWQRSLITGILSASPLPVSPDPAVFTPSLTLTFEGDSYRSGMSYQ